MVEPSAFTKTTSLGIEEQRVNVLIDPAGDDLSGWSALGDGFQMEAAVVLDRRRGVLAIPAGALMREPDGWFAYVVDGDHARKRTIEVGDRNEHEVEVAAGLAAGARVVVYPSDQIEDGTLVAAR
jgi:HlyD family secretion protein